MSECILNLLPVTEEEKAEFVAIAPDAVHVCARRSTASPEQFAAATVIFGWPRPRDLAGAAQLKWFQTMWAGSDEYLAPGILPPGAVLTSSRGFNAQSVAEHMLACLLSLCRRLPAYQDAQRDRRWRDEGPMKSIRGGTVLVAGAGSVGSAFAGLCRALGAVTVGLRRTPAPTEGFDQVHSMEELDALLPQADVVALTLPHSPRTAGLMDARRIGLMKDDAILLSAGRGSVLDQSALAAAMNAGKLWGAALDVCEPEPLPPDDPLWTVRDLILTPHVAGGMRLESTRRACILKAQDNLRRYLAGEPLHDRVI